MKPSVWLEQGLEKVATQLQNPISAEAAELTPLEYQSVCAHLGFNHAALKEASEWFGLSRTEAVATTAAAMEKIGFVTPLAIGAGGVGAAALLKKFQRPIKAFLKSKMTGAPYGRTLQDMSLQEVHKVISSLPRKEQAAVLKQLRNITGTGGMFSRSPMTWGARDYAKLLAGGGGAYVGARAIDKYTGGINIGKPKEDKKRGNVTVISS